MTGWCRPGDVLLYEHPPTRLTKLIEDGECREDPGEKRYFYHCAVALDAYSKIEADGRDTTINPIDYGNFACFRPPYDPVKLDGALSWARTQEGRLYGWIGVFDEGLRDISGGYLHFSKWFITWANNRWPFCSWLGGEIMNRAGFMVPMWPPPCPEDIYEAVKKWPVN